MKKMSQSCHLMTTERYWLVSMTKFALNINLKKCYRKFGILKEPILCWSASSVKLLQPIRLEVCVKNTQKIYGFIHFLIYLAVITLYLTQKLDYDNDTATVIYHSYSGLTYFACIFSAIISDGWWGNFRTILYSLAVYIAGVMLLSVGSVSVLSIPER